MTSVKKSCKKRIRVIIITFLLFCVVSMVVTKMVYDSIFTRYDTAVAVPEALSATVQLRDVYTFPSGENTLTGYHYPAAPESTNALIVLVPGFRAGGDDYLWQIRDLLQLGWGVFTFDTTGTLRSEGDSQVGFPQAVLDLEAALDYIESNGRFGYKELVLVGHSRGGYAACCALRAQDDIAAVVSISGVNSAMDAIMQPCLDAIGPISYGNYGFMWLYQTMLFGSETANCNAVQELSDCDIPVLVVHGTLDEEFPADAASIISYREEVTSSRVEYLYCTAGHTDLLYDTDGTANDALIEHIHEFLLRSLQTRTSK